MSSGHKLALLASLYLSQGLPFGFFTQALPVLLRKQGIGLPAIGLASLLALPWALKFLWAPFVDRHSSQRFGRRRSLIVPLQLATVALCASLALQSSERTLPFLLSAVLLTNLLAATQDIAADGLAVELLEPRERGLGNGVQVAGYRVGMIIGGGLLLVTFENIGWTPTFLAMAGVLALATVPIALHREKARSHSEAPRASRLAWLEYARLPGMLPWLAVLVTFKAGDALGTAMLRPFFVDLGLGLDDIGVLLGTVGFSAGLFGALAGGWAVGRLGRKRALLVFGVAQAAALGLYSLAAGGARSYLALAAFSALEHLTGGMATASLFTAMMDRTRPGRESSDYTLQASLVVIATGTASAVSGLSAAQLGYTAHFTLSALLGLAAVLFAAYALRDPHPELSEVCP
ncbi:MAG: MFS transporter [Polyangiaceae bacterium]|nr:MFS transporter [Polyangiaceae bacterium]